MSRAPVAPLPIDDSTTCDAYDHRTTSGGGASLSPPLSASATEVTDPPRAPEVARLPPGLRGSRYHFYAVRVVGFPEGAGGEPLVAFLRRFGTVPGPGGVQLVTHAWGLEAFLIYQTQEAATQAIEELEKLYSIVLDYKQGMPTEVVLTAPLNVAMTNRPPRPGITPMSAPMALAWPSPAYPVPVLVPAPYSAPCYPQHGITMVAPQPPLPPGYMLVPDPNGCKTV